MSTQSLPPQPASFYKQQAGERAVELVEPGMVVGLGVGSTAVFAVRRLAERLQTGRLSNIVGIPCSSGVEAEARRLGIPLTTLEDHPIIDLTIDGADEIDPDLDVIKGGGGALLREKIVAQATRREVIVADEAKLSPALGTKFFLPVEVIPFGWRGQAAYIESLGARVPLRLVDAQQGGANAEEPFFTDHGNFILDCHFGPIADKHDLARKLNARAGVVENGLFLNLTRDVIVAGPDGIRHLTKG